MKKNTMAFVGLALAAAVNQTLPVAAQNGKTVSKTKLYGSVDQFAGIIHGAGLKIESLQLPTRVSDVRMGSSAFYAGVARDDIIERMYLRGETLQIEIRRKDKRYATSLSTGVSRNSPQQNPGKPPPAGPVNRPLEARAYDWRILAGYDIYLLIDRSASMEDPVEGRLGQGKSRWDYASTLIEDFATEAREFTGKPLKVIFFNNQMDQMTPMTAANLKGLMKRYRPMGGTLLAQPLATALNGHASLAPKDKLLIAVLTDGEPQDFEETIKTIVQATRTLPANDRLQITFLGIGENDSGEGVLNFLDDGLRSRGAAFDVVDLINSGEVGETGMARSLTQAGKRPRSDDGPPVDNQLERMLKRLKDKRTLDR